MTQFTTTAEHLLHLLARNGVEHLFLNPGTDSAPLQEAALTLAEREIEIPEIHLSTFESVALAAAHGYWQVTGRPQCVFVHVDAGTQNLGAMVHNVMRDHAGVVVIAGKTPYDEGPESPGGRSRPIQWQQDMPDQAGIVRGYAKWIQEIVRPEMVERAIGRAVQVATSAPGGMSYLMVSRDVLMEPPATTEFAGRFPVPSPPAIEASALASLADAVGHAERPLLLTSRVGRRSEGFVAATRLADLVGVRVYGRLEGGPVNIATDSPMLIGDGAKANAELAAADLILVVDCDVPWIPKQVAPGDDAVVIQIDGDPTKASMPLWSYRASSAICADGAVALEQLVDALEEIAKESPEIAAAWEERVSAHRAALVPRTVASGGIDGGISPEEVIDAVSAVVGPRDIVIEEAITNSPVVLDRLTRSEPGTLLGAAAPGLGWGLGGALGVKLASPDRNVISIVGDGSFLFGVPTSALCMAADWGTPFMVVILNNHGYRASRLPVYELFPEGVSAGAGDAVGTRFAWGPDFPVLAGACHAYGEQVTERTEITAALRRGLAEVTAGRVAVIDVVIAQN